MPQTSHRPSIPSQIFDILPEVRGRDFVSEEIASRIPWVKPVHVYAALNGFISRGIIKRTGTRARPGPIRGKRNVFVYRVVEPFIDPKTWRSTAEGRPRLTGLGGPHNKPPAAAPQEFKFYKDRLAALSAKCEAMAEQCLDLGAEVENLNLSMFSDLEISREYHARKRARGQE